MPAPTVKIPAEQKEPPKPAREKSSIYVETDTWVKLDMFAKELGRSRNALVRGVLKDWTEWFEVERKKKK